MPNYDSQVQKVLRKLAIVNPYLLGSGGEGLIFSYSKDKIVKIYEETDREYLEELSSLQKMLLTYNLPYEIPQILQIGNVDNTYYTIEKKLSGHDLNRIFETLDKNKQQRVLQNYFEAIKHFNSIELNSHPFGQLMKIKESITDDTWQGFLIKKLEQRVEKSKALLKTYVESYQKKVCLLKEIINKELKIEKKNLVHGDYYLNNVLVNDNLEISAILDFSIHSVSGDRRMDVAGAISFLGLRDDIQPKHIEMLNNFARLEYGEDIHKYIDIYQLYYGFYYSDIYSHDPNSFDWCTRNLNNVTLWKKLGL